MKTCSDLLKMIVLEKLSKPLYEAPKTIFDFSSLTTLGYMYYISISMILDGLY